MCGVRLVSDSCVYRFDSDSRGSGGKYRYSLKATATVLNQEDALCDLSTGVSVSQSLKPSDEGGGLVYLTGCQRAVRLCALNDLSTREQRGN